MNQSYTRAPHRWSQRAPSPNAALLIDFDNVTMGIRSNLGQELTRLLNSDIIKGKVSVQRAYADWRRYPQYVVPLSEASIDLIYAPAYGSSKKNATDIRLAIDALEIVFTRPEIGTYILMSGDSDFSSLVLKLKEYGKYVIGVGMQESSSDLLVQNCDEYYSYTRLSGLVSADEMTTERHDPWELAERSVHKMSERNDVMRSDRMKQVMLELDPSFDEKDLGFNKFNRFLTEAASRGILQLRRIGNGQYEVAPVSPEPSSAEEPGAASQQASSGAGGDGAAAGSSAGGGRSDGGRGRERQKQRSEPEGAGSAEEVAGTEGLRDAYDLLRGVVTDLAEPDEPVRDSEVKRRMLERRSSFDEATLGFSKFSRFLRQAHDEGVVNLIKGDEGNYYLEPPEGAAEKPRRQRPRKGGRRERERGATPETAAEAEAEAETEARPAEPSAPDRPEKAAAGREGGEPDEAPAASRDESRERPAPSRLTRGRRGNRGQGRTAGATASGKERVPGPTGTESGADPDTGEGESGDGTREAPERPATPSTPPRGVGRFRRGRKGGAPGRETAPKLAENVAKVGSQEPAGEDAADAGTEVESQEESGVARSPDAGASRESAGSEPAGDGGPETAADREPELVAHMTENYPGVGQRTAEALVEEFGVRVFDVLDHQPERVEELLPAHRAEAVLAARAEERQASSGDGRR